MSFLVGNQSIKNEGDIMQQFATIVKSTDVNGFMKMFQQVDWPGRELIMAGMGLLVEACQTSSKKDELKHGLAAIIELCKADSTGGSYRENCLDAAKNWLTRL